MIQGLLLLPWLKEQVRRNPHSVAHLTDCGRCKRDRSKEERLAMWCGYEQQPENPPAPGEVWTHEGYDRDAFGAPTTCPGYACSLPAVIDVARLMPHFENGTIVDRCGGHVPAITYDRIDLLSAQENAAHAWHLRKVSEK